MLEKGARQIKRRLSRQYTTRLALLVGRHSPPRSEEHPYARLPTLFIMRGDRVLFVFLDKLFLVSSHKLADNLAIVPKNTIFFVR